MKKKDRKYPFMIEADSLRGITAFPSHTHGLADVGLPEFIMDPYAFGGHGNATRINSAYDFFKKQENDGYLNIVRWEKPKSSAPEQKEGVANEELSTVLDGLF